MKFKKSFFYYFYLNIVLGKLLINDFVMVNKN